MIQNSELPIYNVIPKIKQILSKQNRLIIQAPPGAGKTTTVPLELMNEKWCKKIIMLEPRRIATRSAAYWMAKQLGDRVGDKVGYSVHLDRKISENTVIEVVTEGVFINRILKDPELKGISAVIFDEFHERSIDADLGLALVKETQEILREDLKVIIMSATLNSEPIIEYFNNPTVVFSEGRSYNVDLEYKGSGELGLIKNVVNTVIDSLNSENGSILVFLPGVGEIKRVETSLKKLLPNNVLLTSLYGALSRELQEKAIEEAPKGFRKVVLATSIAESSITIKGIRVVIDSGLVRRPLYNPKNGMESLETIDISQDSADQRMGRAGRVEDGICFRLWDSYKKLDLFITPSILTGDITPLVLTMAASGYNKIDDLTWLTRPSESLFLSSYNLLQQLGAIDKSGITKKGEYLSRIPLHPRLASMVYESENEGSKPLAALVSALLSEKDVLNYTYESYQCDIEYRLEAVKRDRNPHISRVLDYAKSISSGLTPKNYSIGSMLISAYPDRIGKNIGNGSFIMSNGQEVILNEWDTLFNEQFLIIPSAGGTGKLNRVFYACRISLDEILAKCKGQTKWKESILYDKNKNRFRGKKELKLGYLILKNENIGHLDSDAFVNLLLSYFKNSGLGPLNWSKDVVSFQNRVNFLHNWNEKLFPDLSEEALLSEIDWIKPYLGSLNLKDRLDKIKLLEALKGFFQWEELKKIDKYAPTHIKVPSGSNIQLDYSSKEPILKVRLQELFGLDKTPLICNGSIPITIHLLSPASRPIQITKDLKSFWDNTYVEVKKDLKGRYPKHHWPDNPYEAKPTNRIKI